MNGFLYIVIVGVILSIDLIISTMTAASQFVEKDLWKLIVVGVIFAIGQTNSLHLGNNILSRTFFTGEVSLTNVLHIVSSVLFVLVGLYLLYRYFKLKNSYESRIDKLPIKSLVITGIITITIAFILGLSIAFLDVFITNKVFYIFLIISILIATVGNIVGFRYGLYFQKHFSFIGLLISIFVAIYILFNRF
ncbi:MAG: manganese efflux pump [Peptoniphilus sp.]|uniref:manganese efflux pump n=1 Tax=Peptoniphilus sp. TaxID=1971214 RepID=UPI002A764F45|nr:manganese efflux pump [Peptoniphilus sp.]MDY2986595.1 manganese efflux pump [Peptoniphilus sp.]